MLFKAAVETSTLDILKTIMQDKTFSCFTLAGGTALSLQIGHRKSIDLDFFTDTGFNHQELADQLRIRYHFELDYLAKNTVKGELKGIKIDFIAHQYPVLYANSIIGGLRLAALPEIAA